MCVVNTDAVSNQSKTPENLLDTAKCEKNRKYLNACLNKCRHFTPFFALVNGLLRVEEEAALKCISSRLAQKWKEPYSHICRYVKSRVEINLVWPTHHCIQGSRVPEYCISLTSPQWEDKAGLHLFRQ